MPFLVGLHQRDRQPELMDAPGMAPEQLGQALRGLERLNRVSGSCRLLWKPLRALARETAPRPLRVLDLASGGGDVPLGLWHRARQAGLPIAIDGSDRNPDAVEYARRRAAEQGADVRFFVLDALGGPLPGGYDVLMNSLFLHHLDEADAVGLLQRMAAAAGRLVLVNDLVRNAPCLALVYLGTRVLNTSRVNRVDGVRSVRAAFTTAEARELARRAGLDGATVTRVIPCRFVLAWRRT
jgi:2-polyprenyl-3-methyl-5-hydroxy-6-metoxy-1,4-benzoquinol methylase